MIKGVNKLIIEINNTESAYFERAILFLRDSAADAENGDIRRSADAFLRMITPTHKRKARLSFVFAMTGAVVFGAALMCIAQAIVGVL